MAAASKVRTTADDAPGTTRNKEDFLQLRKLVSCLFFLSLESPPTANKNKFFFQDSGGTSLFTSLSRSKARILRCGITNVTIGMLKGSCGTSAFPPY